MTKRRVIFGGEMRRRTIAKGQKYRVDSLPEGNSWMVFNERRCGIGKPGCALHFVHAFDQLPGMNTNALARRGVEAIDAAVQSNVMLGFVTLLRAASCGLFNRSARCGQGGHCGQDAYHGPVGAWIGFR